jgi:hypothetical protein
VIADLKDQTLGIAIPICSWLLSDVEAREGQDLAAKSLFAQAFSVSVSQPANTFIAREVLLGLAGSRAADPRWRDGRGDARLRRLKGLDPRARRSGPSTPGVAVMTRRGPLRRLAAADRLRRAQAYATGTAANCVMPAIIREMSSRTTGRSVRMRRSCLSHVAASAKCCSTMPSHPPAGSSTFAT